MDSEKFLKFSLSASGNLLCALASSIRFDLGNQSERQAILKAPAQERLS